MIIHAGARVCKLNYKDDDRKMWQRLSSRVVQNKACQGGELVLAWAVVCYVFFVQDFAVCGVWLFCGRGAALPDGVVCL